VVVSNASAITAGWLAPVAVSEFGQVSEQRGALDPQGDAGVVWGKETGFGYWVAEATTRPASGSWQPPVELGTCGKSRCEPQIAADPHGDLMAVWDFYTGFTFEVEAAYKPASAAWQSPITLSETKVPGAVEPQVAFDSHGDAMAIWYRGGDSVVEVDEKPAGGAWQEPEVISNVGSLIQARPEVALDPNGDAVAVWTQSGEFRSAFKPAGGGWESPVSLSKSGAAQEGHVGFDAAGDAIAVWRKFTGGISSPMIVQAAYRPTGEGWETAQTLTTHEEIEEHVLSEYPDVAVAASGAAVATWTSRNQVNAAGMAAGGGWSEPSAISPAEGVAREPSVAFDSQGDASAIWTWQKSFGADVAVETATVPAGGTWQKPHVLTEAAHEFSPALDFDAQGDALALWSQGGSESVVETDGFVAAPPSLRSVSIPSSGYVGQPISFSVSPFDVWSIFDEASWSFGDSAAASGTSVTHVYTSPGTYEVTLRGSDTLGNVSSTSGKITIALPPPSPPAGKPSPPAPPPPTLHLVGQAIVHGRGVAFTIECLGAPGQRCEGEGVLANSHLVFGTITFALGAGERKLVGLTYNRELHKLLEHEGTLSVALAVTLKSGGAKTMVASQAHLIRTLDTRIVARSIRKAILVQRDLHTRVSCPRTVIQAKGNDFICYASGKFRSRGRLRTFRTPFRVTQVDDSGDVVYRS
jgi:PKD repeat protein